MSRYAPLATFLAQLSTDEARLTFAEIEALLGVSLPASKRYPAWWSNNPSNNPMTKVWLGAGFVTEQVDIPAERLVFRRAESAPRGVVEAGAAFRPDAPAPAFRPDWLADLRAKLGGTVTVAAGWDLTNPTGEVWDAERA